MILALAILPMMAFAQVTKNVRLTHAGQFADQISEAEKFAIVSLTISGPMNGKDVKLMQEIVNRTKAKEKKGEYLTTHLDLSGATLLEGKEVLKLKAHELPSGCFSGAKELLTVKLPSGLRSISKNMFNGCSKLKEVTIPSNVSKIEDGDLLLISFLSLK